VAVNLPNGISETQEVHAGGGYLSQCSPTLFFGLGTATEVQKIEVRWPDGSVSNLEHPDVAGGFLQISQP
jgi:hypothetical protein